MKNKEFFRPQYGQLLARLQEPRRFMQVLIGPRQVGKTSLVQQVLKALQLPYHYASADEPGLKAHGWISQQWNFAHLLLSKGSKAVLVLDEIQKLPTWSDEVKLLWDDDTIQKKDLLVVLLGSSPMLMQQGLSESLAGRFEVLRVPHWSFAEMHEAFGLTVDQYVYFGGYPGAAAFIHDEDRFKSYVNDSLIETTLSRDVFLLARIQKPALLRRLFSLGCSYSGQILSYQKIQGQLQDAGNTTTLAHYANLLCGAGLLCTVDKFAMEAVTQRASSPKWQVLNTALMSASEAYSFEETRQDGETWGRYVESAVGAHLLNTIRGTNMQLFYWRERNQEVDFIVQNGKKLLAIEVKSGGISKSLKGQQAFMANYPQAKSICVGGVQGMPLEDFLTTSTKALF